MIHIKKGDTYSKINNQELAMLRTSSVLIALRMHCAGRDPIYGKACVLFGNPNHPDPVKSKCVLRVADMLLLDDETIINGLEIFGCNKNTLAKKREHVQQVLFGNKFKSGPRTLRDFPFYSLDMDRIIGAELASSWLYQTPSFQPQELADKLNNEDLSVYNSAQLSVVLTQRLCETGFRMFSDVDGKEHWMRFAETGDPDQDEKNIRVLCQLPHDFDDFEEQPDPSLVPIHVKYPILNRS